LEVIRGRYGLLTALVVAAMLSVAAGAGLLMVYAPLCDPSVATREQLFYWLIFRDLSTESAEIRQKILNRLDTEFEKVGDIGPRIENMEESRRQMLWHNVTVLMEPWLLGKVEEYSKLPDSLKMDYIDRFLDRAEMWNQVGSACLRSNASQGPKDRSSVSQLVAERIQQCGNHAAPEQRQQIGTFVRAVETRWLWRQLPSFNLFGKPAN
jgi:hypothetical protein